MPTRRTLLASIAAAAAAGTVLDAGPARAEADAIRMSHGLGVLYLPLIVMREAKLVEKHLEAAGLKAAVSWVVLDGGGQINDAMLAGALDIAGTSIPGFLTLWSKGKGTRSEVVGISGLSTCALVLNTNRPEIRTLADFKPGDKIAVPSREEQPAGGGAADDRGQGLRRRALGPAGREHRQPAAPERGGGAGVGQQGPGGAFRRAAVHAGGGGVPRVHAVLRSPDTLGDITLDMVYGTKRFADGNPGLVKAFLAAQAEANALISTDPARATALFIQNSGSKVDPAEITGVLQRPADEVRHGAARVHGVRVVHAAGGDDQDGAGDVEGCVRGGAGGERELTSARTSGAVEVIRK